MFGVREDTIVHSQLTGLVQRFARLASENDAGIQQVLLRAEFCKEVVPVVLMRIPAVTADQPDTTSQRPAEVEPEPAPVEWIPPTWEEIVRDHSARVYRLAYRLTGNPHDAEDLTQDVFVRVFRSLHRFQPGTFEGWLHRITTNLFLDGARRRQKIRFDGLADGAAERLKSAWPTPISITTSPPRWRPCRPTSAPPWCCVTSRV